jgi:hypothetical protein
MTGTVLAGLSQQRYRNVPCAQFTADGSFDDIDIKASLVTFSTMKSESACDIKFPAGTFERSLRSNLIQVYLRLLA